MTASSHPFGFHMTRPQAQPIPLRHVPAMQAATIPDQPPVQPPAGLVEPLYPMCVACGNRRDLAPRGQERYPSGASVLVCRGGCQAGPVQATTGVITAAMSNGAGTPREWAQAAHDCGLLFDPERAKDIETAARAQERAEMRAELGQAQQDAEALAWFHARWLAAGRLCEGRPPGDMLPVGEIVTALDGRTPAALALTLVWDGQVAGPVGDGPGETTLVGCATARGGRAVLALDDAERVALAEKLLDSVYPAQACATPGCGEPQLSPDEAANPAMSGWIALEVAGVSSWGGPRWWCSPPCATAAMTAAGAELAAADQLAAIRPQGGQGAGA